RRSEACPRARAGYVGISASWWSGRASRRAEGSNAGWRSSPCATPRLLRRTSALGSELVQQVGEGPELADPQCPATRRRRHLDDGRDAMSEQRGAQRRLEADVTPRQIHRLAAHETMDAFLARFQVLDDEVGPVSDGIGAHS